MKDLNYWLRKKPQPIAILADERRIEVTKGARIWNELVATIKAMEPSKLTCLDGQGNVIRSVVLEGDDDEKTGSASAEMSDLQMFAKLLAEGYQHGMKANQPIIDSAMQFVERQGQRLMKLEAEVERLRAHIHKQNLQIAELSNAPAPIEDGGIMGALAAAVVQSQGQLVPPAAVTAINKKEARK
jgi:hypothetical protein